MTCEKRKYYVQYVVAVNATSEEEALTKADEKMATDGEDGHILSVEECDEDDDD